MKSPRRRFLSAAAGAAALSSCGARRGPWRFFTEQEMATVAALTDCLIPPDDLPGAAQAGVPVFLDRQLSGHLRKFRDMYRAGLLELDLAARKLHQAPFAKLSAERQTALLQAVEKGKPPDGTFTGLDPALFFATVRAHTMQGFYGDPRHGGNRDQVAYLMLGIPATNLRGRSQHDVRLVQLPGGLPGGRR